MFPFAVIQPRVQFLILLGMHKRCPFVKADESQLGHLPLAPITKLILLREHKMKVKKFGPL